MSSKGFLRYFTDVLVNLNAASSSHSRSRLRTASCIGRLQDYCDRHGVTGAELISLVRTATSGSVEDEACRQLVSCLTPKETIPKSVVFDIICSIASRKGCDEVQASLLEWLLIVHPFTDSPSVFALLYSVIFQFLDRPHLCVTACKLLFWISKRGDVTPFRVSKLTKLHKESAGSTLDAVSGLLALYKLLHPPRVPADVPLTDKHWYQLTPAEAVRTAVVRRFQASPAGGRVQVACQTQFTANGNSSHLSLKRRHGEDVSSVAGLQSRPEAPCSQSATAEPTADIAGPDWFLECLPSTVHVPLLALPAEDVDNHGPQSRLLLCTLDPASVCRLSCYIDNCLFCECLVPNQHRPSQGTNSGHCFLQALVKLSDIVVEPIPVVESFLEQFLPSWDGLLYQDHILALIAHVRMQPFEALLATYLQPLYQLYLAGPVQLKTKVMRCWSQMLANFVKVEMPRLVSASAANGGQEVPRSSIFSARESRADCQANDTVARFIAFVDQASPPGLRATQDHPLLQQAVLRFFHNVSALCMEEGVHFIPFPSPTTTYCLLLSRNAAAVSGVCTLLSGLFSKMTQLLRQGWNPVARWQHKGKVTHMFNRLVLDVVNMLFKGDLFPVNPEKQQGSSSVFLLPTKVLFSLNSSKRTPKTSLTLYNNIAFQGAGHAFFLQNSPVKPSNEDQDQSADDRGRYIAYLETRMFGGVREFQNVFLSTKGAM